MRKPTRHLVLAVPAALILATAAACSSSSSPGPTSNNTSTTSGAGSNSGSSGSALAVTSNSSLGQIVTNGSGMTVYRYDLDTANSGKSNCTGACASAWPPVTVTGSGTPTVTGVSQSQVGEITRSDGTKQLTLAGWPLYTYAGDSGPGSITGQGISGTWWAVTPAGAKAASGGGSSPSTSGNGGGTY